jgi:hypothetical protein
MTKISDFVALTGASVDSANDLVTVVDMSATGAARNKKMVFDELKIAIGAYTPGATDVAVSDGGTGASTAAGARSNLGLLRLIAFFFTTAPTTSEVLCIYAAVDAFTIPANMSGSQTKVGTNPAATFAIDVQNNGSTIGTISISTGGVATLTTTSGTSKSIAVGDVIKFVAPASADASIANVSINVKGTL